MWFTKIFSRPLATIFTLHRVGYKESGSLIPNENMKISPYFLDNIITHCLSNGYEFINLDQLHDKLIKNETTKRKIIFTLDDGYKDNYEVAYPIFKKYKVPFTIYLTTSFPDNTALLWWYVLEDLISTNTDLLLGGKHFSYDSYEQRNRVFMEIRKDILSMSFHSYEKEINAYFTKYNVDWVAKCNELALSWEQLKILTDDPLVTIGGHTVNHSPLNKIDKDLVYSEIVNAHKIIENKLGLKVEHFAYPFGSIKEVGVREFSIVKNLGIKTATTTANGSIKLKHANNLESLPRIMLTENFDFRKFLA